MFPARTKAGNYGKSCKDLDVAYICGNQARMHHRLIQETEQPKRNPETGADLGIVNCKVAVRDIRNLFEGLSLAAHLKEVPVVDEKVSLLGVTDVV